MAELKADVLVLGAGMVGVSAALHLQQRGRDVILVDSHTLADYDVRDTVHGLFVREHAKRIRESAGILLMKDLPSIDELSGPGA